MKPWAVFIQVTVFSPVLVWAIKYHFHHPGNRFWSKNLRMMGLLQPKAKRSSKQLKRVELWDVWYLGFNTDWNERSIIKPVHPSISYTHWLSGGLQGSWSRFRLTVGERGGCWLSFMAIDYSTRETVNLWLYMIFRIYKHILTVPSTPVKSEYPACYYRFMKGNWASQ